MTVNYTSKPAVLTYGRLVINDKSTPVEYIAKHEDDTPSLQSPHSYCDIELLVSVVEIELCGEYETMVSVMYRDIIDDRYTTITGSLGMWRKSGQCYQRLGSVNKTNRLINTQITALLNERLKDGNAHLRIMNPRRDMALKIEQLAKICRFSNSYWSLDSDSKPVYMVEFNGLKEFNPYTDESWVWPIIRLCGVSVEQSETSFTLTKPGVDEPLLVLKSHVVLRAALCDWLLRTTR